MRYPVMIRRTRTGYSADVPDLLGCVATGKTMAIIRRRIARAIELHLEVMAEHKERIPSPAKRIQFDIDPSSAEEFGTWVEVRVPKLAG